MERFKVQSCSLHQDLSLFVDDWWGTNDKTHLHGTNVLINASMLGSTLKITSLGWKTSTFPQRGYWNVELHSLFLSELGHIPCFHSQDTSCHTLRGGKVGNLFIIFFQHPSVKFTSFLPQFTRYGTGEKGVQWCSNSIFFWVFKGYFDLCKH